MTVRGLDHPLTAGQFLLFFSMTVMWALGAVRNWNGDVELMAACEHDWSMYVACLRTELLTTEYHFIT